LNFLWVQFGGGASAGIQSAIAGRLLCDTYLSSREFVKEVSYTLGALASNLLKMERKEFDVADVPAMYG
jgi:DNA polymerase alpha subunit A